MNFKYLDRVVNIAASNRNPIKYGIFVRYLNSGMCEYVTAHGVHHTPIDNMMLQDDKFLKFLKPTDTEITGNNPTYVIMDENILISVDHAPGLDVGVECIMQKLEDGTFKILNIKEVKNNDPR